MPELPEVEYHARELRRWLEGRRIERAEADKTRMLRGKTSPKSFAQTLSERTVASIDRRGKFLVFHLDNEHCLLSHLGMSGKWLRLEATDPVPRASHARLYLSDTSVLHNVDPRMFGILQLVQQDKLDKLKEIRDLGPDPLRDRFDGEVLRTALGKSRAAIKALLLNPRTIAGIGNIHATEALFHARIHPSRSAASLSPDELAVLAREIVATIHRGLAEHESHGAVVYLSDHTGMENPFAAYGRAGEPCPRCATRFSELIIGGRTSVFCSRCQKTKLKRVQNLNPRFAR
ncbi:MAG TPA: bifunctional DNA-formamidopyrimidine glycosylase/DNA-(apurinic or apyrimidinic site) lyase [Polyangium sp.]|nr:bifunctional DNA-formamidopyrimidine glycosylase/DNA-(apurinic or apyrimidinic site) lyase [Polyangium sp.]